MATEKRGEFDPRKFLQPAMAALEKLCRERFEAFGTASHAARIRPLPLSAMAKRYAGGSLTPTHRIAAAA